SDARRWMSDIKKNLIMPIESISGYQNLVSQKELVASIQEILGKELGQEKESGVLAQSSRQEIKGIGPSMPTGALTQPIVREAVGGIGAHVTGFDPALEAKFIAEHAKIFEALSQDMIVPSADEVFKLITAAGQSAFPRYDRSFRR
ncbi:MAG: hypothetical protein NT079_00860, partial [Candidatus Omnitrophica bacterium]|nr:hypothetical protein [Candidatus Omnitrophota bacterium]